jgi:HAD superfamily hydrolase (TIGR01509 family)
MLSAVIFDFDGVIVNSEPFHYRAYQELLAPEGKGYTWAEYLSDFIGFDDRDAFRTAYRRRGEQLPECRLNELVMAKSVIFQRLIRTEGIPAYPGAVELIRALSARLPLGLCSGALRSDIQPVLERLGIPDAMRVIVTAEDVHVSKPDPACYVDCVRRLAAAFPDRLIRAADSLAIEDTPAGIEAARGAGLRVLAVASTHAREQLAAADRVVGALTEINLAELEQMI